MAMASWHKGHFRVALLLAWLLPWQSFAAVDLPCAAHVAAASAAASTAAGAATPVLTATAALPHCHERAAVGVRLPAGGRPLAGEHHSCPHCDACAMLPVMTSPRAAVLLSRATPPVPPVQVARAPIQPPLDRLDRPPRTSLQPS